MWDLGLSDQEPAKLSETAPMVRGPWMCKRNAWWGVDLRRPETQFGIRYVDSIPLPFVQSRTHQVAFSAVSGAHAGAEANTGMRS